MILLGNGDGTFQSPIAYAVGLSPQSLVMGDFTGNGHIDIAAADVGSNDVALLIGHGDGTFAIGPRLPVGFEPTALIAADLAGTGRDDLIAADRSSHDLTIWRLHGRRALPAAGAYHRRRLTHFAGRPGLQP